MAGKSNHEADIKNPNHGTSGTNITWDKAQGNRGAQLNPNNQPAPSKGGGSSSSDKGGKRG